VNQPTRLLLGTFAGVVVLWASSTFDVALYLWLLSAMPWWWEHHLRLVSVASEMLAVVPCVVGLGLMFGRVYSSRPVLCALASMALALLVAFAETLRTPERVGPTIRLTWEFFLPFLVGPALIVYLARFVRSNRRWSGP
jgi:hypothetical protein